MGVSRYCGAIQDTTYRIQDIKYRIQDTTYTIQDIGEAVQDIGRLIQDISVRIQDISGIRHHVALQDTVYDDSRYYIHDISFKILYCSAISRRSSSVKIISISPNCISSVS